MFGLPEAYWATITTLVVVQSTLGAAWKISLERLLGTVLGALMGVALEKLFPLNVPVFGAGVFLLGIVCALLRIDNAYRFAAITLAVVMLIHRTAPGHVIAFHRFVEVTIGILVGLLLTVLWPQKGETLKEAAGK